MDYDTLINLVDTLETAHRLLKEIGYDKDAKWAEDLADELQIEADRVYEVNTAEAAAYAAEVEYSWYHR